VELPSPLNMPEVMLYIPAAKIPPKMMVRYDLAMSNVSSGVLISLSSEPAEVTPIVVIMRDAMTSKVRALPTDFERDSLSLAPKYWATMMPAPVAMAMKSTSSRLMIGIEAPTAERALSPTYLPTTIESTVAYSCWAKFPMRSGTENLSKLLMGRPWVMS
jgi:hypothetical protein